MKKIKNIKYIIIIFSIGMTALFTAAYLYPLYKAKNAVREVLNDPNSAQFEELFRNSRTGDVCGYVNAKNRMGGYVGKKLFLASSDGVVEFDETSIAERLARMDSNQEFTSPLLAKCHK